MPQFGKFPENLKVCEVINLVEKMRPGNENGTDMDLYKGFGVAAMSEKKIKALSGGMKQKLSAHLAFLFNPPVLILDEPTAGLDPISAEILKEKILHEKQKGKTILLSNHIMPEVEETATHIIYLKEGKLVFFEDKNTLKETTGEEKLVKAITQKFK
ncbi:ATP-binding cassette domain-containing protein [Oscillatoria amoena NRMC-F 0135]|nr:ATP-binding cassette domain-containing protein [Oscillatoria amoena NRMC-F 0135]